jgi:hypothetical protein
MAVTDIIAAQQEYAADAIASADAFLDSLNTLAGTTFFVQSNAVPAPPISFDLAAAQSLLLSLFPDALADSEITATPPAAFSATSIDTPAEVSVPEFAGSVPVLDIPTAPSTALPTAPSAPYITAPAIPTAPTVSLPAVPTVAGITFPSLPSISIPEFTAITPTIDLTAPTNNFAFYEEAYSSTLLDALKAKLLNDIENGGYGIEVSDEIALFNRARDREIEAMLSRIEDAGRAMAMRGFPLPPGELSLMVDDAYQTMQDKVSSVSRDIMLERSKLYVENRQFTITEARGLEQILIGYHNSVMERSLNAAKAVLEAAIQVYNAQVAKLNLQLEAYRAEGVVFEARVRAQLAQVELYRTQMEGKRIESDVQRAQIEVYSAQIAGVNALVGLYRSQLEAAQVQTGVEKLRIDSFAQLVNAYVAKVQAKTSEFQMFESAVRGQAVRADIYKTEVGAYATAVDAAKSKNEIIISRLRGQIEAAANAVAVYRTQMDAYKIDVDAQAQTIDANVRVYGAQVQGASAKANAMAEARRLDVFGADLEFRRNVENAKLAVEDAKLMLQALVASAETRSAAAKAGSGYYQALVGGAVNSITALSSIAE